MIIYKTTNLINGKIYIGQDSKNDPKYLGSGIFLKRAIKKHGYKNFKKEILEECNSKEELDERERYWIKRLDSQNVSVGYNIANGGQGGGIHTEETKKLIGSYHKGKTISKEQREKTSERMKNFNNYSQEFLDEQKKDKNGENSPMYGETASEETKKKMSEAHKKNPIRYWKGKKRTRETVEKTVASRKNKTPEQKLDYYINWYFSKFKVYPTQEQKQKKYEKYLMKGKTC
jgi:group I intron endonuclease